MKMQCHDNMSTIFVLHQKRKRLPHIGGVRIVGGNSHSTLVVNSSDMTYDTWLAFLQKIIIYIYTYITTYPLNGAHAFNAAWTMLQML
jgi:hypothetical protein